MPFTYAYPRPAVTADAVIFTMRADDLAVLLIKRGEDPFKGAWALPGGHVEKNESLEKTVARELEEETGLSGVSFDQLGAFGDPGRDPRGHYVTVVYYTLVASTSRRIRAGDDASEVAWVSLRSLDLGYDTKPDPSAPPRRRRPKNAKPLMPLAFDHAKIVRLAVDRLRERLLEPARPARFHLVPPNFTLTELRRVYEVIFSRPIDARAFRRGMIARDFIEPITTPKRGKKPASGPNVLFRFKHAPHRRTSDD